MRRFLLFVFLCVGTSVNGYTDLDTARRAYAAVPFSDSYASSDQRSEMATAIQAYWQDFDGRLPKLTPRELEWITGEVNSKDMARLSRAMQAREYHLWELSILTDQCTNAASQLMSAVGDPALEQTEMFHWTKVAYCYQQSSDKLFRHLQGAGLDSNGDANDGHTLDHLLLSRILLVIIPSSMADTMGWQLNSD